MKISRNNGVDLIVSGRSFYMAAAIWLDGRGWALAAACAAITAAPAALAGDVAGNDAAAEAADTPDIIVIGDLADGDNIAGSGNIVDADALRRSRVLSVNDALRQVPGVFPRDEEGAGARPNIGIRGLNPIRSTKVLLLEDGIPLGFAPYGDNSAYYHPPIERFDRVEVLKGAAQIRFGPQSIGGVINYITPDAPDRLTLRGTAALGNRDALNLDALVGGPGLGGRLLLHANHKRTDGNRDNQRMEFTDLFAKASWDIGSDHSVGLKISRFSEDSQVSYSGLRRDEFAANPRGNIFVNDSFVAERWNVTLAHRWALSDAVTLKTSGYYHNFKRDWWRQSSNSGQRPNDASDPACGGIANLLTTCGNEGRLRAYDTWGVESRLTLAHDGLGFGGETEIGVRFHEERQKRRQWNGDTPNARTPGTGVNGGVRENNERDTSAIAAFIQSRIEVGPVAITPGVRGEFIDYERRNLPVDVIVGGRPTGAKTGASSGRRELNKWVPGVGVVWTIAPEISLYGGVHRGFAPPRVEDIITGAGGSVDLDAELSWNYELGLRGRFAKGVRGDLTLFVLNFENQIVAQSVAGGVGTTLTSAGRTLHRGAEASLTLSSRDGGWTAPETDIYARLAATWVKTARYNSTRIATAPCFDGATTGSLVATRAGPVPCGVARNVDGNRLPYSPEWLVNVAVGAEHRGFAGQLELVGQSSMFADDVNLIPVTPDGQRGRIGGWAQLNAAISYGPPEGNWEVFATARNLFDRLYVIDRARGVLPGQPFTILGGFTLRY
jgi:Fe(3+) dicitrate transport protein